MANDWPWCEHEAAGGGHCTRRAGHRNSEDPSSHNWCYCDAVHCETLALAGVSDSRPETMANVLADAVRHTDDLLERAEALVHQQGITTWTIRESLLARTVTKLVALVRYWRQAAHAEADRTHRLTQELADTRQRQDPT